MTVYLSDLIRPRLLGVFFLISAGLLLSAGNAGGQSSDVPDILPRSYWNNSPSLQALTSWLPQQGGNSNKASTGDDATPVAVDTQNAPNSNTPLPDYAPIQRIVIHDSGCVVGRPGCNNKELDAVSIIQSMYRFHAVTRGWGDIGYHFIIDYDGKIYEGRSGGNGARGAHTYYDRACQNFNVGTIGIVLLGNYAGRPVPAVMEESLAKLVAWLSYGNDFDPGALAITTKVWTNKLVERPGGNNSCDVSVGGYTNSFTGPAVLTHHDVEPGNPDVATLNLPALRARASGLKRQYDQLALRSTDGTGLYVVSQGKLRRLSTDATHIPAGGRWNALADVLPTELGYFPLTDAPRFADGTVVTVAGAAERTFLIKGGVRYPILSPLVLADQGLTQAPTAAAALLDISSYPEGKALTLADGSIIRSADNPRVYIVKNGAKYFISSGFIFDNLGLLWSKIRIVPAELVAAHETGPTLYLPDGTLIKSNTAPAVYVLENGARFLISSQKLFQEKGYQKADIIQLSQSEVDFYPLAGYVHWPDGAILKAREKPEVYAVLNDKLRWVKTRTVLKALGIKSGDINVVSPEEIKFYELAAPITVATKNLLPKKRPPTVIASLPVSSVIGSIKTKFSALLALAVNFIPSPPAAGLTVPPPAPVQPASSINPIIRVALCWLRTSAGCAVPANTEVEFTAAGAFRVLDHNKAVGQMLAGEAVKATAAPGVSFRVEPLDQDGIIRVISYHDSPAWNPALNDNEFRGSVELIADASGASVWLVNELPLESYLKGIGEVVNEDSLEYKKVLIAAARSYAYYYLTERERYPGLSFNLNNTAADQIYKGYGYEQRSRDLVQAVDQTRGQIIEFQGKPIVAAYSSDSGGVTKDACQIWGGRFCEPAYAYLRGGVADPPATGHTKSKIAASHGVGISTVGARQMIAEGKTYREVISFYYPGTAIVENYGKN